MAEINRASLFYDNLVTDATLSATTSASASLGVNNLKTFQLGEKWRSTSPDEQTVIVTLSEAEFANAVFLWGHNLSGDATVRIRISNSSDLSSPVYDVTFFAWQSFYGWGEGGWGGTGWGGTLEIDSLSESQFYSLFVLDHILTGTATAGSSSTITIPASLTRITGAAEESPKAEDLLVSGTITLTGGTGSGQSRTINAYNPNTRIITVDSNWSTAPDSTSTFKIDLTFAHTNTANDGTYNGMYLGVTIDDPANSDGYIEAGWLGAGQLVRPTHDISVGYEGGHVDPSERFLSYGQTLWVNQKNKHRSYSCSFDYLTETEARADFFNLGAVAGSSKPVVLLPFTENSFRAYTDSIYGLLDNPPRIRQTRRVYSDPSYSATLNIRGLIA